MNLVCGIQLDKKVIHLFSKPNPTEYERLRPLSYMNASVFLICFSVGSRISFENVKSQWYPEVRHFCPDVPIILVGTKADMLNDETTVQKLRSQGQPPVSLQQGTDLANDIGAEKYIQCSAVARDNVKQVFDEAVRAVLQGSKKRKSKKCTIL